MYMDKEEKTKEIAKMLYRQWKESLSAGDNEHPDEETFACFYENKLSRQEINRIKLHLVKCSWCAEALAVHTRVCGAEEKAIPVDILENLKNMVKQRVSCEALEILLKINEAMVEVLRTNGEVLFGQELLQAELLRSKRNKNFKDEVNISKDFRDLRVEVKIENEQSARFTLFIAVKNKNTQLLVKDLRVALFKEDLEMESYSADSGKVCFEHVLLGKYTVEISKVTEKLASISLDIKI